jgi:hypothetical protein
MNLIVNCSYFDRFCNMGIHVQFLMLDVKMNYVDHKFIFGGSAQSNAQIQTCINK